MGLTIRQTKSKPVIGLEPRLEAAFHLGAVLGGAPFTPIGAEKIAEGRDRALANRLVTVALRRHGQISHILSEVLDRGLPARSGLFEASVRLGIAQLLYIEDIPAHSAIHLAVESVRADRRSRHLGKLANAVLRGVQRGADDFAALPVSLLFPDWLADRWRARYGPAAIEGFASALLAGAPLDLTLKVPDPDLMAALGADPLPGASVRIGERSVPVSGLPGYEDGRWWVQDLAAALPAMAMGARTGQTVLDLCAAPGGKTAQLAAAGAEVTALDLDPGRMDRLKANLGRVGLTARTVIADALDYRPEAPFDAVLLDAPCSATGTFRRHPDVLWNRDPAGIGNRVALQRALIETAAALVRPGGRLVYCVCSLEAAEGEEQYDWALAHIDSLVPDPIDPSELGGWAAPVSGNGTVRTHPAMAVPAPAAGTLDGFFIARFTRR